ncbi:MAG: DUF4345 domain-containing protein [Acidobacteriales bacterium]|nr:DUF4345 domain-containing protein [Terriglobales bacterium]
MSLTRLSLALTAAAFTGFGVACFARPRQMLAKIDVAPTSDTGITEIRAMYGGMELGLGAFFAYCATQDSLAKPALLAQITSLGGLALARLWSILEDDPGWVMYPLFVAEAGATVLGVAALREELRVHK